MVPLPLARRPLRHWSLGLLCLVAASCFVGCRAPRCRSLLRGSPTVPRTARPRGLDSPNMPEDIDAEYLAMLMLRQMMMPQFKDELKKAVEDEVLEEKLVNDLQERDPMKNVSLANEATVILVGVNHASKTAAKKAAKTIRRIKPSALMLELCSDRLPVLIQGNDHREEKKSWMDPDQHPAIGRLYKQYADETRRSLRAFMNYSGSESLLVLGDLKAGDLEDMVREPKEIWQNQSIRSDRDSNMAKHIFIASLLGHETIVAVMGANHVKGVTEELQELNVRYLENSSALGEEIWSSGCTGLYISHLGCKNLQRQQRRLKKDVPADKWFLRDNLPKQQRRTLVSKFHKLLNPQKILNSLSNKPQNCIEPKSWKDLLQWWRRTSNQ